MFDRLEQRMKGITGKREGILAAVLSLAVVLGVTIGMGTITSGFHLVDDHEFARWRYEPCKVKILNIVNRV